jgi:nucleotide-binding universal stress UspA family protein
VIRRRADATAGLGQHHVDVSTRPRSILVGYDGSDAGRRALEAAAGLVGYGSMLAVATVRDPGDHTANVVLSEARETLLHRQLHATYLPRAGEPVDELLEAARELEADLVVVGSRSVNGSTETTLGPVSDAVVQRAPCDVLVVR